MAINPNGVMVIKPTVTVGYTESIKQELECENQIFSPEFLRKRKALYDNLNPSRIVVGESSECVKVFGSLLLKGAVKKDVEILHTDSTKAEVVNLFSNNCARSIWYRLRNK